tara:strand:+ start:464 stop:634 length:171 start_codon:yes stop_codon:yes gene_type:complete
MAKYEVTRTYECSDVYIIVADSEADAIQKAVTGDYEHHESHYGDEDTECEATLIEE